MTLPIVNDGGIIREMTQKEHAEWQALCAEIESRKTVLEAAAAAKASARTKLAALGLTDAEIAAFLGA